MLTNLENAGAMAAGRDDYTSVASFVFDLESELSHLEAWSTTLDVLLLDVVNGMRPSDRGRAAAIDVAVTNLRDQIHDLACRYEQLDRRVSGPASGRGGRG